MKLGQGKVQPDFVLYVKALLAEPTRPEPGGPSLLFALRNRHHPMTWGSWGLKGLSKEWSWRAWVLGRSWGVDCDWYVCCAGRTT